MNGGRASSITFRIKFSETKSVEAANATVVAAASAAGRKAKSQVNSALEFTLKADKA